MRGKNVGIAEGLRCLDPAQCLAIRRTGHYAALINGEAVDDRKHWNCAGIGIE